MKENLLLVDFDGTINLSDLALHVVKEFGSDKWKYYEDLFNQRKLSLEDTVIAQYSLIKTPPDEICKYIDDKIEIRNNFIDFVNYCIKSEIQIKVVSGGIDFVIKYVLEKLGFHNHIEIFSINTEYQKGSLNPIRPSLHHTDSIDFKHDLVRYFKAINYNVIYIGDGSSDYGAVMEADEIFCVSDSILSKYCKEQDLEFTEFTDFKEIVDSLKTVVS